MTPLPFEAELRAIMDRIVQADYAWLAFHDAGDRLSAEDLRTVITEYGRTPVQPPESSWASIDVIAVRGETEPAWAICLPLYTLEEGQSDLTLELTIRQTDGTFRFALDDLHVL